MPSPRNHTLRLTADQEAAYAARCLTQAQLAPGAAPDNATICGDTLQVCPLLAPGRARLLIADPPYNMNKNYHGSSFAKTNADAYADYTRRWLEAVLPLLQKDASVYVCCDWESSLVIGNVLGEYLTVKNRITWQREKGRGAAANWKNSMEDIWFAVQGKPDFHLEAVKLRRRVLAPYRQDGRPKDWQCTEEGSFRDTCPGNFWDDVTVPFWSMPENTDHPTQKPEKLLAKLILSGSAPGELVLDPFLGSGSTSVTAKKLGRRYLGIEQNPRYCAWAEARLEKAETDKTIQGYRDGIFWERNSGR